MGFGGISPWSLLIILAIVILLFGTKRLRNIGGDLGGAIKNFKKSVKDGESSAANTEDAKQIDNEADVIDAEAQRKDETKS